jgi:hypothetical protein
MARTRSAAVGGQEVEEASAPQEQVHAAPPAAAQAGPAPRLTEEQVINAINALIQRVDQLQIQLNQANQAPVAAPAAVVVPQGRLRRAVQEDCHACKKDGDRCHFKGKFLVEGRPVCGVHKNVYERGNIRWFDQPLDLEALTPATKAAMRRQLQEDEQE